MIFITSIPKAGTHLLASVVQELYGVYPVSVKKSGGMHSSSYSQYVGHPCLVGHFRDYHLAGNDGLLSLFKSRKVLVLIRDPRDVVVSMVHYLLGQRDPRQRRLADLMRDEPLREQIMMVAGGISLIDRSFEVLRLNDHCDGFLGIKDLLPEVCVVRYEDFFTDTAARQLSSFLGFSRRQVKQAVTSALGGRSQTKRQGVAFDWIASFDEPLKAYFDGEHGTAITSLGYSLSSALDTATRKIARLSASRASTVSSQVVVDSVRLSLQDPTGSMAEPQAALAQQRPGGASTRQSNEALLDENLRLKRLLGEAMLELDRLREQLSRIGLDPKH